jgi:hypothetical protein
MSVGPSRRVGVYAFVESGVQVRSRWWLYSLAERQPRGMVWLRIVATCRAMSAPDQPIMPATRKIMAGISFIILSSHKSVTQVYIVTCSKEPLDTSNIVFVEPVSIPHGY